MKHRTESYGDDACDEFLITSLYYFNIDKNLSSFISY